MTESLTTPAPGITPVGDFAGRHVFAEFSGVDAGILNDEFFLRATLLDALRQAGATVLEVVGHRFDPQGVTILALLAESHASIHTYPEWGSAFVDVFTCGERAKPEMVVQILTERLRPSDARVSSKNRGYTPTSAQPTPPGKEIS